MKDFVFDSRPVRPSDKGKADAFMLHPMRGASVSRLISLTCPAAVVIAVAGVVVKALYGHSARALAHIFKKAGEHSPLIRHADPSSAVSVELREVRVRAALDHPGPYVVGAIAPHAMRYGVCGPAFRLEAAA